MVLFQELHTQVLAQLRWPCRRRRGKGGKWGDGEMGRWRDGKSKQPYLQKSHNRSFETTTCITDATHCHWPSIMGYVVFKNNNMTLYKW